MSEAGRVMGTEDETLRNAAIDAAALAVSEGEVIVLPTDTVYGIGADAFDPRAVQRLLAAKGRGRDMPPPVLVHSPAQLAALTTRVPDWATALTREFWPGPLTVVCHQQGSLTWDLGETRGTVAVRMPDHPIALAIIEQTGPMAVSSANLSGRDAAKDAGQALAMLGDSVQVYVDAGPAPGGVASTIVDATTEEPRVLRWGALGAEDLNRVLAPLGHRVSSPESPESPESQPGQPGTPEA